MTILRFPSPQCYLCRMPITGLVVWGRGEKPAAFHADAVECYRQATKRIKLEDAQEFSVKVDTE